jgi:hypothetical protein
MKIIQTLINKVMKKGTAMEGFIREDGTIRPIEHYDDTELRGKIQTNTDNISNLDSRVTELEEHGGVEDPTKADKVENATAGNLASLDEEGNLQDSGKAIDLSPTANSANLVTSGGVKAALDGKRQIRQDDPDTLGHAIVSATANDGDVYIMLSVREDDDIKYVRVTHDNMPNLQRALEDPDTEQPTEDSNKLVTSGAVKAAIDEVNLSLSSKEDAIPLIGLQQASDETNWEPNTSYDSIYTAACSWGKTRPVLVRFLKIDTFDVTLIGTLSANFNSADGTAKAVICAGGYKFVRSQLSPASSIEELIWDNGGVTQTAISL